MGRFILLVVLSPIVAQAARDPQALHVAPGGRDDRAGTENEPLATLRFLISGIVICGDAEILMEEMEMKAALDPIFFLEVIDEDEMMGGIGNLPEKVNPVSSHIHKESEDVLAVSRARNSPSDHP